MTPLVQANSLRIPLRSGSVNLIVTSPPYFGQRRYEGGEQQIGNEPQPQDFLDALWAVTAECWRVLADDGVMFVNLGDKRAGSSGPGTTSGMGGKPQGERTAIAGSYTKAHFGRRKSKQMLPHRYIIGCEDGMADPDGIGWVVSDYVWAKRGGMPESVTDRCRDSHEYVFQMAKSERWFSGIDDVREPHVATETGRNMNGWRPGPSGQNRGTDVGRRHDDGGAVREFAISPLGKTPSSVWTMTTESLVVPQEVREAYGLPEHFASYPQELPRRAILGWSPSAICTACGDGRRPVVTKTDADYTLGAKRAAERVAATNGALSGGTEGRPHGSARESTITGYACACTPRTNHRGKRGDWKDGRVVMPEHGSDDFYQHGNAVPRRPGGFGDKVPAPEVPMIEYHLDGWVPPPTRKAVVLDPFCGTGTTVGVARALGRIGIGLDLSFDYLRLARWRVGRSGHFSKTEQRTHKERQGSLL